MSDTQQILNYYLEENRTWVNQKKKEQ
jgi:hypothetical protein